MHRELKRETTRPPASNLRGQQRKFDRFQRPYNEERQHDGIGGQVPAERCGSRRRGPTPIASHRPSTRAISRRDA
jgi:transposase InsO family protein